VLKTPGWVATGLLLGVAIHAWLVPTADPPPLLEPAANRQTAGAESRSEYARLADRVRKLEAPGNGPSSEPAEILTRITALEEQVRKLSGALAIVRDTLEGPSGERSTAFAPTSRDAPLNALAMRFWNGPPGAVESTEEALAAVPLTLTDVAAEPGQVFVYEVTGSTVGAVWGTDIYTDDSSIAASAVHSGLLQPDETAAILVTVLPGQQAYTGSSRYGVVSSDYAQWTRSYALRRLN